MIKSAFMGSKGLRARLFIAIALMSFIPLLVIVYLVTNYILPGMSERAPLGIIGIAVFFTAILASAGLIVARGIIEPVINMAREVREIADGDLSGRLVVEGEDELADLGRSVNLITKKIKDHLGELQAASAKTKEVNIDIQKKVVSLSNLLQISDMIAASERLETIFDTVVQKVKEIDEDNFAALFLARDEHVNMELAASSNIHTKSVKPPVFHIDKDFIGTAVRGKMAVTIDSSKTVRPQEEALLKTFKAKNLIVIPVIAHGSGIGFMAAGNDLEKYTFPQDDVELANVLCRQLGIAIENAELSRRADELSLKDNLTGLYNEKYIRERLHEEIQRSILYQRPCSLLLFNIDNFKHFRDSGGELVTEEALKKIATVIVQSASKISKVARLGGDEFAVVLPEKNKKEATEMAEEMRKKIELLGHRLAEKGEKPLTISGGISENPLDGATADELFGKAHEGLRYAKEHGKNRIAV